MWCERIDFIGIINVIQCKLSLQQCFISDHKKSTVNNSRNQFPICGSWLHYTLAYPLSSLQLWVHEDLHLPIEVRRRPKRGFTQFQCVRLIFQTSPMPQKLKAFPIKRCVDCLAKFIFSLSQKHHLGPLRNKTRGIWSGCRSIINSLWIPNKEASEDEWRTVGKWVLYNVCFHVIYLLKCLVRTKKQLNMDKIKNSTNNTNYYKIFFWFIFSLSKIFLIIIHLLTLWL